MCRKLLMILLVTLCAFSNAIAQDCDIFDATYEFSECTVSGAVYLTYNFQYTGTSDTYIVGDDGGGVVYNYADLPISIGPFVANGENIELEFIDSNSEECFEVLEATLPLCDPQCQISNINFEVTDCDSGYVEVWLDFDFEETGDQFIVGGDGGGLIYDYDDLPVFIGLFIGNGAAYNIEIIDTLNESCFSEAIFETPNCPEPCDIFDVTYEISQCDDLGNVLIVLDFDHIFTGDHFILGGHGNGQEYTYADLPVTIQAVAASGQTIIYEIVDEFDQTCFAEISIDLPECSQVDSCAIENIVVEPIECIAANTYVLTLDFSYQNIADDYFEIFSDGQLIWTASYNDLPLTINNFPNNPNSDMDEMTICAGGNDTCCETIEFEGLLCTELCQVNDLFAEAYIDCNEDGSFNVDIEFDIVDGNGSGFDVFVNGAFHSTFVSYPVDYITIVVDSMAANVPIEIVIADGGNENCAASFMVNSPDCFLNSTDTFNEIFDVNYFNSTLLITSELTQFKKTQLFISNTLGVQIFKQEIATNSFQQSLDFIPAGIYFVTLAIEDQLFTKKISVN